MGSGNLKADDRFIVRVSSERYGSQDHGPYSTLDTAREVKAALMLAADLLHDDICRQQEIIILKPAPQPIVITVEDGVIQSIDNIPPGQVVQVWDFDVEYADDEDELKENERGEKFYLSEYVGSNK